MTVQGIKPETKRIQYKKEIFFNEDAAYRGAVCAQGKISVDKMACELTFLLKAVASGAPKFL